MEKEPIDKFRTLYFVWESRGDLWIAKDPLHNEMRWVIRPTGGTGANSWELIYVLNGSKHSISNGPSVDYLGWIAVTYRTKQIADIVFCVPHLTSPEKVRKGHGFLTQITIPFGPVNETGEIP